MFNKIKGVLNGITSLDGSVESNLSSTIGTNLSIGSPISDSSRIRKFGKISNRKYRYKRPHFLKLENDDEILLSADQLSRPIIVAKDGSKLPWNSGYAEAVNAGKSPRNEDQATVYRGIISTKISKSEIDHKLRSMVPAAPKDVKKLSSFFYQKDSSCNQEKPKSDECSNSILTNMVENSKEANSVPKDTKKSLDLADELISPSTPLPPSLFTSEADSVVSSPLQSPLDIACDVKEKKLPYTYFGIFDGHAGPDVSIAASNRLHLILHTKLQSISDLLIYFGVRNHDDPSHTRNNVSICPNMTKLVTIDSLIIGALEKAFWDMDKEIEEDKSIYQMQGGCTALVALFILGKLFVANAGDSRGVLYKNSQSIPMSFDFTPETERERIKKLGFFRPDLVGHDFTPLEFVRRPTRKDLGKKLLYKDVYMSGWIYKTITFDDLKFPLIFGDGKRSRLAATIGVTRGFGDHELRPWDSNMLVKPFLTPQPEVRVLDIEGDKTINENDVLILGTDGLWDVISNEKSGEIVRKSLEHFPFDDESKCKYRYVSAAQDLVMFSRGKPNGGMSWSNDEEPATIDDISVFVIPLKAYKDEYIKWKETINQSD